MCPPLTKNLLSRIVTLGFYEIEQPGCWYNHDYKNKTSHLFIIFESFIYTTYSSYFKMALAAQALEMTSTWARNNYSDSVNFQIIEMANSVMFNPTIYKFHVAVYCL